MTKPRPITILHPKRTTIATVVLFFCLTLSPTPASEKLTLYAFEQPHMGTLFRIKLYADSKENAQIAATAAFNRIADLDAKLSDYIPDSELKQLGAAPPNQAVPLSVDLFNVLEAALNFAESTDGRFDPTIGYASNLWRRSLRKGILPTPEQLADAKSHSGHHNLALDHENRSATLKIEGMFLDLGGIAKGFAADEALKILNEHNITRAAVAAGGDIRTGDPPPHAPDGWKIPVLGIDRNAEIVTTTVHLKNAAISTSGDREQFVEIDGTQYAHIIDPKTGLGLTHRVTASVIAPTATQSDALATTLCIVGNLDLDLPDATHALLITRDTDGRDQVARTDGFPSS
ncbi:MAG: FAD:protein FMN transferase [Verrucomicrobiota bacterium]